MGVQSERLSVLQQSQPLGREGDDNILTGYDGGQPPRTYSPREYYGADASQSAALYRSPDVPMQTLRYQENSNTQARHQQRIGQQGAPWTGPSINEGPAFRPMAASAPRQGPPRPIAQAEASEGDRSIIGHSVDNSNRPSGK